MFYYSDYLKKLRQSKDLTQIEFSELLGISISTIRKIEGGNRNVPQKRVLQVLADYENRSSNDVLADIIFGSDSQYPRYIQCYLANLYSSGYNIVGVPSDNHNYFTVALKTNQSLTTMVYYPDKYDSCDYLMSLLKEAVFEFESSSYGKFQFVLDSSQKISKGFADSISNLNKGKVLKKQIVIYDYVLNIINRNT